MTRPRLRLLSYMVGGFPLVLFERIAASLDADLDVDEARSGPVPGDDPFDDGRADLGWICSTSYVDLATRRLPATIQLGGVAWVPDDPAVGGRPVYFGDVVTREPVPGLTALAGATIGCNDEVSLSGHLALRIALHRLGHVADDFADLRFTGGHRRSLERLVAGELDAAVIDSVVLADAARTDPRVSALHRVTRLGPWPTQPLVASSRLPAEQVDELASALIATNDDPAMRLALADASLSHFTRVGADHYQPVRRALERL